MRTLYLLILLSLFACNATPANKGIRSPSVISQIVEKSKQYKSSIDTTLSRNEGSVQLFAKVTGQDTLVLVEDGEWPDDTEYSINMMRDTSGNIIRISSTPVSQTGDWNVECIHYFNQQGNTVVYEKRAGAFVLPNDGLAFETITDYFDTDFIAIKRNYDLLDKNDNPLDRKTYAFTYNNIDTVAYSNLAQFLKAFRVNQ
ncbi:MAG: hypothetical protein V4619_10635 [Bacteroidota bacterium]